MEEEEERIVSLQVTLEQRPGFGVRSVLVRLVVIKVALGQFLLSVLQFSLSVSRHTIIHVPPRLCNSAVTS